MSIYNQVADYRHYAKYMKTPPTVESKDGCEIHTKEFEKREDTPYMHYTRFRPEFDRQTTLISSNDNGVCKVAEQYAKAFEKETHQQLNYKCEIIDRTAFVTINNNTFRTTNASAVINRSFRGGCDIDGCGGVDYTKASLTLSQYGSYKREYGFEQTNTWLS